MLSRYSLIYAAPVLQSHVSLQLPQTPNHPAIVSPGHRSTSQTHSHFPLWHDTLNTEPIPVIIHRLTAKFFCLLPLTPQTPEQIGQYTLPELTPLDELSIRRRDLYLTTHNTHNRKTPMPPVRFEPTISAGERPKTYALDRAAIGTGMLYGIYNLISITLLSAFKTRAMM